MDKNKPLYRDKTHLKNYDLIFKNNEKLYEDDEDKHYKDIHRRMGLKLKDFNDFEKNFMIMQTISENTANIPFLIKMIVLQNRKKAGIIKRFKKTKFGFDITDSHDNVVSIQLITKKIPKITKLFPELVNFHKRTGYCHFNSIMLAKILSNENVEVVTGYVKAINEEHQFLHSWVETITKSGKKVVVDFNFNAIFDKDDYYKLRNVGMIISKVSKEEILSDLEMELFDKENGYFLGCFDYKEYLVFREEIMHDIKKNKEIFENSVQREQ